MDDRTFDEESITLPMPALPQSRHTPLRLTLLPGGPAVELVKSDVVAGRHTTADIRLPLPDVSRRHCRFVHTGDCWQVIDLESLNGIYVNGVRVVSAVLGHRDRVQIGGFHFLVELGVSASATTTENAQEFIQRIAEALPHRKAS